MKEARSVVVWIALLCLPSGLACFNAVPKAGAGDAAARDAGSLDGHGDATVVVSTVNPTACTLGSECPSGHCVDGLCCNTSCDGQCESCNEPGSRGICKAVTGAPVGSRDACGGTGMCKGQCDGTNGKSCTYPGSAVVCAAASCMNGKVTTASTCDGAGACTTAMPGDCPDNQCASDGAKCANTCTASSCGEGFYCDATGVCLPGQANGSSCSLGATCASGYCVDGVCCDAKCDGQCESCKEAGAVGTCTPVKGAPPATRMPCGGTGMCKGQCDGVNKMACAFPGEAVICTAGSCAAGKATTASVCNGSGACTTATTSACTSNLCATDGSGKCSGSCTAGSCAAGSYCDSTGTCTKTLDNGASCSAANQCTSGNCVDGVCCDGACDGQCQSCKDAGSVGKCKTIRGDPVTPRPACGGTGKCKAQCGGTNPSACTFPDSATECTAAKCTAGKVTTASVCNGSGSCTASATNACDSNLCAADGITCAGSCTATSCAAGTYCGPGGACAPTIANGKPCSANNQCTSGQCVGGVCCATTCGACHSCATGTCTRSAVGTSCTAGASPGVCNSAGMCNACSAGTACTTGINTECQTGAIDCTTGAPVCKASNKSSSTLCGPAPSCTAGRTTGQGMCLNGACMTPAPVMCQSGACSGTQCLSCTGAPGASTPPTTITASKTGLLCAGTSVTLTVSGGSLGTGASWAWYPNSTFTGKLGTGASIVVSPTESTSYYVRAEGPCNTTTAVSRGVLIRPPPQFATNGPADYAVPCGSTDTVKFTVIPSADTEVASYMWYYGDYIPLDPATRYYAGGTTATLTLVPQSSWTVFCVITDVCGKTAESRKVTMSVPNPNSCP